MKIIGCDFHPSFQQIAMVDMRNGRVHGAKADAGGGAAVLCRAERAGAGGHGGVRQHAVVRASAGVAGYRDMAGRCRQDPGHGSAQAEDRPSRCRSCCCSCCWRVGFRAYGCRAPEQRDTRQLLLHRHKLVGMRRQVKNELQHLALNQGVQQKRKLWSVAGRQRLEALPLTGWTAQRREDSLELLDQLNRRVAKLDVAAQQEADRDAVARLLQTHPGVGPITALAFSLTLGDDRALRAQPPGGQLFGAESGGAFQRRTAAAGRRSASRAIPCCAVCWWKRDRARRVLFQS